MIKRKDGLYQQHIVVEVDGVKKRKYFYGRKKKDVLDKIREYREISDVGPTYKAVSEEWWAVHEKELSYNSVKAYSSAIRRAEDHFGQRRVRDIRPADISAFLRSYAAEHDLAHASASIQRIVINLALRYAVEKGYLDTNPCRDAYLPSGLKKGVRDIASDEDIKRVKESRHCTFGDFAYWAIYTGMRRGELLALTWEDVDLTNRVITVSKSLHHPGGKPTVKRPKTDAGVRVVPIIDALLCAIPDGPRSGPVFPSPNGGYLSSSQFFWRWAKYRAESHVTATPHQLRHAYATMLFEVGIDSKDAQILLGHANETTTRNIYTHIRKSREERTRDKLMTADY